MNGSSDDRSRPPSEPTGNPATPLGATTPPPDPQLLEVLEESQRLGFLGPGPVMFHVEHATGYLRLMGEAQDFLDLGSGGGLPGLVLCRARPSCTAVLLDAMERRCAFLRRAVEQLGLTDRVEVVCGRAEELAHSPELRERFGLVVSRSFGAPAVTAECAVGFLRPGGRLIVSEPPAPDPARWPADGLARLGLVPVERVIDGGLSFQILEMAGPLAPSSPRRVGVPSKRPLF